MSEQGKKIAAEAIRQLCRDIIANGNCQVAELVSVLAFQLLATLTMEIESPEDLPRGSRLLDDINDRLQEFVLKNGKDSGGMVH